MNGWVQTRIADGGAFVYRTLCPVCDWKGSERDRRVPAMDDLVQHVAGLHA